MSCLFSRAENKLELRHTLEGHQLGVVSVDINSTGNSILTFKTKACPNGRAV